MIDNDNKLIFVHVIKTAGVSVETQFKQHIPMIIELRLNTSNCLEKILITITSHLPLPAIPGIKW